VICAVFDFGILIPCIIGFITHTAFLVFFEDGSTLNISFTSLFQDWVLGDLLLISFLSLLNLRIFEYIEASFGVKYNFTDRFHRGIEAVCNLLVTLKYEIFVEETVMEQLADANETIIHPLRNYWLFLLLFVVSGALLGFIYHFVSILSFKLCEASAVVLMVRLLA